MGDDVSGTGYSRERRQRYREKVRLCLDVFERMLADWEFDSDHPMTGLEIELNLVDAGYQPTMTNMSVLEEIADPAFQTELGAYNIELNVPPRPFDGRTPQLLEADLRASLNAAEGHANAHGAHIVMVGILPTIMSEHLADENWMSPNPRYAALNESIFAARGEDIYLDIHGPERLVPLRQHAGAGVGLHQRPAAPAGRPAGLRPDLERRPAAGRPAARAGRQLAVLLRPRAVAGDPDRAVHAVHRHPPDRAEEPGRAAAGVVRGALDHLDLRPVRGERPVLPVAAAGARRRRTRSPSWRPAGRRSCRSCGCTTAPIYRWNRPIYDVVDGRPHVRVENRVLPAGPTVVDILANAAFYYGVLRVLADEDRPVWTKMTFADRRGELPEPAPGAASTPRCTGRGWAR